MHVVVADVRIIIPTLVDMTTGTTIITAGTKGPITKDFPWDDPSIKAGHVLQAFLGAGNPCGAPLTIVGPVVPTNNPPTITLVGTPTSAQQGGTGTASFDVTNPNNVGISYQVFVNNAPAETFTVGAGQTARLDVTRPAGDYTLTLRAGGSVTNPVTFTIPSAVTPPPPVAAPPTITLKGQPASVDAGQSTTVELLITNTADDTHASAVYHYGDQSITVADGASGVLTITLPAGTHQVTVTGDDGTSASVSVTVPVAAPKPTPTPTQTPSPTTTPAPTVSAAPAPKPASTGTTTPAPATTQAAVAVSQGTPAPAQVAGVNNQWQPDLAAHGDVGATQSQAGSSPWMAIGMVLLVLAGIFAYAYIRMGRVLRRA
jgi:hypothetical protein